MKWKGLFLICLLTTAANGAEPDSVRVEPISKVPVNRDAWFAWDKFHHFTTSALLVCSGSAGLNTIESSRSECLKWAVGFSFSMGLIKEFLDMRKPRNHFCWKDLVADLAGIGLGIWIMEQWQ
jgi:uncharacterized protein YfiM (DUF2279 family)